MTTPSASLRAKLALTAPLLNAASARLWRPEGLLPRYRRYLTMMHAVVRASVPLLEAAGRRCAGQDDPWAVPLAAHFARHAREEQQHDAWLLEDLALCGGPAAPPSWPVAPPLVAEMVGAQYYWIAHHDPAALLGYVAVLEGNAPAPWLADRLARETGLPAGAFRTLSEHAALDDGHVRQVYDLLDQLPPAEHRHTAVSVSALHSAALLIRLFLQIADPEGVLP